MLRFEEGSSIEFGYSISADNFEKIYSRSIFEENFKYKTEEELKNKIPWLEGWSGLEPEDIKIRFVCRITSAYFDDQL